MENNTSSERNKNKMEHLNKRLLMQEYFNRLYKLFLPVRYSGFCRFTMKNGQIMNRTFASLLYNVCVLIVSNICAGYMIYIAVYKKKFLILPETITVITFNLFANLMIIEITFGDKRRGSQMIEKCIQIDAFFGIEATKFMRDVAHKAYVVLSYVIGIANITVVTYMFAVFEVSMAIHVVASTYFIWLLFCYYDFCFFIYHCIFITMRARYLNVALMNTTRLKREYIPKQLLFNTLFWKDEYDDKVTFNDAGEFVYAYRMLYEQWRRIERCYRFPLTLGVLTIVMGTFITVQTYATYLKTPGLLLRAGAISMWSIASWFFMLIVTLQTDMFYRQIEQTKLICAYTQLKPTNSSELFKLTKNILRTLAVREARASLYDVTIFNTSLTLKLMASTFVYITAQLQLAFPSSHDNYVYNNSTIVMGTDDPNYFRKFLV